MRGGNRVKVNKPLWMLPGKPSNFETLTEAERNRLESTTSLVKVLIVEAKQHFMHSELKSLKRQLSGVSLIHAGVQCLFYPSRSLRSVCLKSSTRTDQERLTSRN